MKGYAGDYIIKFPKNNKSINYIVMHSPAIIQIMFIARVMQSVGYGKAQETDQILFSEEKDDLSGRRGNKLSGYIRKRRMDLPNMLWKDRQKRKVPGLELRHFGS